MLPHIPGSPGSFFPTVTSPLPVNDAATLQLIWLPVRGKGGTHEATDHSAAPDAAAAGGAAGASEGSKAEDNNTAMNDRTGTRGVGGNTAPVLVAGLQDESTTADYMPLWPTKLLYSR